MREGGFWSLADEPRQRREAGAVVPSPSVDPLLVEAAPACPPPRRLWVRPLESLWTVVPPVTQLSREYGPRAVVLRLKHTWSECTNADPSFLLQNQIPQFLKSAFVKLSR